MLAKGTIDQSLQMKSYNLAICLITSQVLKVQYVGFFAVKYSKTTRPMLYILFSWLLTTCFQLFVRKFRFYLRIGRHWLTSLPLLLAFHWLPFILASLGQRITLHRRRLKT